MSQSASRENFLLHAGAKWLSFVQSRLVSDRKLERLIIRHWDEEGKRTGGRFRFLRYPPQPLIEPGLFQLIVSSFEYPSASPFSKFPLNPVTGAGDGYSLPSARLVSLVELVERTSFLIGKYHEGFSKALRFGRRMSPIDRDCSPPSSTGMAFHRSPESALSRAILECLERDAYLCHWLSGIRPAAVTLPGNRRLLRAKEWCAAQGLALQMFRLRSFVPEAATMLAVAFDPRCRKGTTLFATGVACGVCPHEAFERAVFELSRFLGLGLALRDGGTKREDPGLAHPMGRFYHYLRPENLGALGVFLPQQEPEEPILTPPVSARERAARWRRLLASLDRDTASQVFAYPAPVPASLKDVLFGVLVDIPALQKLDYEIPPCVNDERLARFAGRASVEPNKSVHPLP